MVEFMATVFYIGGCYAARGDGFTGCIGWPFNVGMSVYEWSRK